ncbi:MAG TPA: Spy/CpxP family protein refolding chaperone [Longimicrobiales bacterium]|nr:Spy/CpxP family protein refolding chaperone [Longimicrobiales bacterium]
MMTAKAILAVGLPLLLGAGAAAAQQRQHDAAQQQPGMMGMEGMMMMGVPDAGMILHMRGPLGLTDAQVKRLEAIRTQTQKAAKPQMDAAMAAHRAANGLLETSSPDFARFQTKLREAAEHMVRAHVEMAKGAVQARAVLTPEQRANVRFGMRMMQQMMQERGMEMMGGGMAPGTTPGGPARGPAPQPRH